MADVVLENVSKRYDQVSVIRDVSLAVRDREFVVLVGPSGCGKSTLLRMIAGLETLSGGTIRIADRLMNAVPPKDRDIAMVFQNYALYPHMSVYDNMAFGLKMRKTPKTAIDAKVREAAKILDLEALLQRKPRQLSGGQRQRVALGRAIVRNPKVFLMDEPLSNLDAKLRVQMRREIAALHKRLNATTIYVTHDQVEAMTMGDRIVILNKGDVQQVDTPLRVYHEPANMFVAGFVGQMNFLHGRLETDTPGAITLCLADDARLPLPEKFRAATSGKTGNATENAVVLGIRPEHLSPEGLITSVDNDEVSATASWTVEVVPERVEITGNEQVVSFPFGGHTVLASWSSEVPAREATPLRMTFHLNKAFLFDADTQARLV
jgi:multiple sugar transport system ATP-binding protein